MSANTILRRLRRFGNDQYKVEAGAIVRHRGCWPLERLSLDFISGWRVDHEMIFDCITITLTDGHKLLWLDTYGDLLNALRQSIPNREAVAP